MIKRTAVIHIVILISLLFPSLTMSQAERFDLVIKDGRIVDGSGNPWFYGDIGIKDGKIAKVGQIDASLGAEAINAERMIVAPGFIDVHAHVEGGITRNPQAENFIRMGVTSVVTGNCGGSWLSLSESFRTLEQNGISVNLASLIGHNTVRRAVMKEEARDPSPEEMEKMKQLVDQAMRDGAVGFATGLIYIPGTFAKTDEVIELAKVAAKYGGIYVSHIRNEEAQVADAIKEAINVGEKAGLPVEISHFKISSKKLWGQTTMTVRLVREARERGLQVTVDQYAYTASSTGLEVLIPSWVHDGGRQKAVERLRDPQTRQKIIKDMFDDIHDMGFKDWSYAVVANYRPDPSFNGKTIAQITEQVRRKKSPRDQAEQIIEMFLASEGRVQMVYHKMNEKDVEYIMQQPFTMIASDAGVLEPGQGVPHPRGYGNNVRVLGRYVREKRLIGLEDAIRKMTSLPAQTFKLWDRGLIRSGFAADLVIFDDQTVTDRATFDNPHQYADGVRYVIVNGRVVVSDGKHTGARPGKVLYGPGLKFLHNCEPVALPLDVRQVCDLPQGDSPLSFRASP